MCKGTEVSVICCALEKLACPLGTLPKQLSPTPAIGKEFGKLVTERGPPTHGQGKAQPSDKTLDRTLGGGHTSIQTWVSTHSAGAYPSIPERGQGTPKPGPGPADQRKDVTKTQKIPNNLSTSPGASPMPPIRHPVNAGLGRELNHMGRQHTRAKAACSRSSS